MQNRIKSIQSIMIHDNAENKNESLSMLIQNVSLLFQENAADIESQTSLSSPLNTSEVPIDPQLKKETNALKENDIRRRYRA